MKINIIGGGVVGCIQAIEFKRLGFDVAIYEKNNIGSGSTNSGAGIMYPLLPHLYDAKVYDFIQDSKTYYSFLNKTISELFDIDIEYFKSGMLVNIEDLKPLEDWLIKKKIEYNHKDYKGLTGIFISDVYQINPKKLILGLVKFMKYLGIHVYENHHIQLNTKKQFTDDSNNVIDGDKFVLTAGAWTSSLNSHLTGKIYPIKGQLIEFENTSQLNLEHIIYKDKFYLLQRQNGSLIAGSTLENVGFNEDLSPDDLMMLRKKAENILPELKKHKILNHWYGFRPGSKDNIPIIMQDSDNLNTFYNVGHFRYGISMAPATTKKLVNLF